MSEERRGGSRSPTQIRLRFASSEAFFEHYATNLSLGGIFIATRHPPPVGTELALHLELEDTHKAIEARGRVAHIQKNEDGSPRGVGVEFTNLSPEVQKALAAQVEKLQDQGKVEPPRRQAERVASKLTIRFASANAFLQQYLENLSSGGLFIATKTPAQVGTKLTLELHLPETDSTIEVEGEVVHVRSEKSGQPAGMGIAFVNLSPQARRMLEAHVALFLAEGKGR